MSLTGTGTVKVKPDEGYISLGVTTYGQKSADAVAANTRAVKSLFETLAAKGVKEDEIRTLDFSVSEHHKQVWDKDEDGKRVAKTVRDGFVVHNSVQVTVCDLSKFGEVLDAVTAGGANSVGGISFGYSKSKDALAQARKAAVKEALAKAGQITEGLDLKLGRVLTISEHGGGGPRPPVYAAAVREAASPAGDVPVSGGSLSYSVTVSVTWELVGNR